MAEHNGCPVRIRGNVYVSMAAAARALGVNHRTVARALEEGRIDEVGLRRVRPGKPCVYRGKAYPSVTDAARACGVSLAAVSKANRRRRQQ